jgi:hypothetical protein
MTRSTRRDVLKGLAVPALLGLAFGLGACTVRPAGRTGYDTYPNYYYDYYYYPQARVYYHPFSSDYYYWRDSRWWRTRVLPKNIWLNQRYRVPLKIKKDRPFDDHDDHFRRHARPSDWERDQQRNRRDREDDNRRERQNNTERHFEYHRKSGR